ncbi:unnamed protein product [Musa acuminata var. zebrina]
MIPGLTDDAARECLTRVPYNAFPTLFSVCKLWRQELRDPTFHRFRKSTGIAQPVVVLVQPYCTYYNCPGLMVYRFVIFEPATAGGHDGSANPLRSALAYDVGGDSWKPLPDMARKPFNCRGVILRGKFVVLHRHCAEAFDPAAGSWGPVEELVPPGEQYPTTCVAGVDGSIYRCVGREVMVQLDGGVWATVAKLPSEMRVAMNAVAWEGKLMVMGIGMRNGTLVAKILDIKANTTMTTPASASASASWRNVEVPPEYQWHVEVACCLVI